MELTALQEQLSVLQQQYDDASEEIESLDQRLAKANKELRTLRSSGSRSVSTTQTPPSPADSEALKREAALRSEIEDLKAKLQTLTEKETQEDSLRREIETLQEENGALQSETANLRSETADLRNENGDLHQKVNKLEAELNNSTSDFQTHLESVMQKQKRQKIYHTSHRRLFDRYTRDSLALRLQYPGDRGEDNESLAPIPELNLNPQPESSTPGIQKVEIKGKQSAEQRAAARRFNKELALKQTKYLEGVTDPEERMAIICAYEDLYEDEDSSDEDAGIPMKLPSVPVVAPPKSMAVNVTQGNAWFPTQKAIGGLAAQAPAAPNPPATASKEGSKTFALKSQSSSRVEQKDAHDQSPPVQVNKGEPQKTPVKEEAQEPNRGGKATPGRDDGRGGGRGGAQGEGRGDHS